MIDPVIDGRRPRAKSSRQGLVVALYSLFGHYLVELQPNRVGCRSDLHRLRHRLNVDDDSSTGNAFTFIRQCLNIRAMNEAVNRACKLVGGVGRLATLVGVAPPTVTQWTNGARPVSPKKAVRIEVATDGRVTRQQLCPDDWHEIWPELASDTPITTTEPATAGG